MNVLCLAPPTKDPPPPGPLGAPRPPEAVPEPSMLLYLRSLHQPLRADYHSPLRHLPSAGFAEAVRTSATASRASSKAALRPRISTTSVEVAPMSAVSTVSERSPNPAISARSACFTHRVSTPLTIF